VYLAAEKKNKDEIQGSFTPFRMTTSKGRNDDGLIGEEDDGLHRKSKGRKVASQERK
jgi:hypothetical protein